jgi:hypothetical protein
MLVAAAAHPYCLLIVHKIPL